MLRDIFKQVSGKDSAYKNIYYLTDTEIRFSINDDRVGRIVTVSVRYENDKFMAYGFERSQISTINSSMRNKQGEVKTIDEFWKWYSDFYNDIN